MMPNSLKRFGPMTPKDFLRIGPRSPEELIGKARAVAEIYCASAQSGDRNPIRLLFVGNPGIGKSAACRMIANAIAQHPIDIRRLSAAQITVDDVRDWMVELQYANNQWRVWIIEEADAVNPAVGVLLLQFLDGLREGMAVLATSNEKIFAIDDRFQSRFQSIKFVPPSTDDVENMLLSRWPELGDAAKEIAETSGGDVRASLNDAQMELDKRKYGKKASGT